MTYNVGGGHSMLEKDEIEEYKKRFKSLLSKNGMPNIVCVQEAGYNKFYLENLSYPHHHKVGGNLILSDYEIKDKGLIKFKKTLNRIVWADVVINNKIMRVVNMHLQSNKVSAQTEDLVNNPDLREKETWVDMKSCLLYTSPSPRDS